MSLPKIKHKLYHGTSFYFDIIDLSKGKKYKDFGSGFYLSYQKSHAEKKAISTAKINKSKNKYIFTYYINQAEFNKLYTLGRVKFFQEVNIEWVDFILKSRYCNYNWHNYDVVIGATADDETKVVLNAYREGFYGAVNSFDAKTTLIRLLHTERLSTQVLITTKLGLSILDLSRREVYKL